MNLIPLSAQGQKQETFKASLKLKNLNSTFTKHQEQVLQNIASRIGKADDVIDIRVEKPYKDVVSYGLSEDVFDSYDIKIAAKVGKQEAIATIKESVLEKGKNKLKDPFERLKSLLESMEKITDSAYRKTRLAKMDTLTKEQNLLKSQLEKVVDSELTGKIKEVSPEQKNIEKRIFSILSEKQKINGELSLYSVIK